MCVYQRIKVLLNFYTFFHVKIPCLGGNEKLCDGLTKYSGIGIKRIFSLLDNRFVFKLAYRTH